MFVDSDDEGCHFEAMLKDAVLLDYDPDGGGIAPSCSACTDESCTYHPANHETVSAFSTRCAGAIDVPFISPGSGMSS